MSDLEHKAIVDKRWQIWRESRNIQTVKQENSLLKEMYDDVFNVNALLRAYIKMHSGEWISDVKLLKDSNE